MCTVAEALSDLDSIPWDRLIHFYGRASDIPAAIRELASSDARCRTKAHSTLTHNLEHQDGVLQATAFAVPYIVRMLAVEDVPDKCAIVSILRQFLASARFQLEHHGRLPEAVALGYRGHTATYWPEFVSEEHDEILWEESEPSSEEYTAWQQLTEQAIVDARGLVSVLSQAEDADLKDHSRKLLELIDCNSWTTAK